MMSRRTAETIADRKNPGRPDLNEAKPQVSIIIPVFNRATQVLTAIRSATAQTLCDIEVIVIDDHSTDQSRVLAQQAAKMDPRVRVVSNTRAKGAQGARNTGILNARAPLISFLDSDDSYHPQFCERMTELLRRHPQRTIATCFSERLAADGSRSTLFSFVNEGDILPKLLNGTTYVDTNSAVIPKDLLLEIGLLDEECPSYQELDTHIRLARIASYATVPKYLTTWTTHADQISTCSIRGAAGGIYVLRKHRAIIHSCLGRNGWHELCAKTEARTMPLLGQAPHLGFSLVGLRKRNVLAIPARILRDFVRTGRRALQWRKKL